MILDHDAKLDAKVAGFLKSTGLTVKRTSIQAAWQNGRCERWIGSCRREMLDHVIALNEEHLRRLVRDYVCYHQEDRIHDSLDKDAHGIDVETGYPVRRLRCQRRAAREAAFRIEQPAPASPAQRHAGVRAKRAVGARRAIAWRWLRSERAENHSTA